MSLAHRIFLILHFSTYSALSIRDNRDRRVHPADCVSTSDDETFTGIRSLPLSSPLARRRCIATEGRAASSRERLRHRVLLSATRPAPHHRSVSEAERMHKVERTESGERRRWWRQRGGGRRKSAGKGVSIVVPDVQHHYTAFFDDAGVRDLSPSLFLSPLPPPLPFFLFCAFLFARLIRKCT